MEDNRFNQTLRDKFQDLESPFNDRVTFEAVMKKREKKKRRVIFLVAIGCGCCWIVFVGRHWLHVPF